MGSNFTEAMGSNFTKASWDPILLNIHGSRLSWSCMVSNFTKTSQGPTLLKLQGIQLYWSFMGSNFTEASWDPTLLKLHEIQLYWSFMVSNFTKNFMRYKLQLSFRMFQYYSPSHNWYETVTIKHCWTHGNSLLVCVQNRHFGTIHSTLFLCVTVSVKLLK
jgi:hypothetical protein